jgi:hypothetical protein
MPKREQNKKPTNASELEHVEAEKVEDYHITSSGKIEQTPEEKKRMYKESLLRTIVASLIGIVSGAVCYFTLGAAEAHFWLIILMLVMIFTYYLQKRVVLPALRMDMKLLNGKDWIGIQFLVLIYCLVTWTILLNLL